MSYLFTWAWDHFSLFTVTNIWITSQECWYYLEHDPYSALDSNIFCQSSSSSLFGNGRIRDKSEWLW